MLPYILTNDRPPNIDGTLPAEQVLVEAGYQSHSIHKNASSDRFMDTFMLFSNLTGIGLNEQDFFIDGYQVNPWELYGTISSRNGFDSVCLHDYTISYSLLKRFYFSGYEWRMAHGRCRPRFPSGLSR